MTHSALERPPRSLQSSVKGAPALTAQSVGLLARHAAHFAGVVSGEIRVRRMLAVCAAGRILNRFTADTEMLDSTLLQNLQQWLNCVMPILSALVLIALVLTPLLGGSGAQLGAALLARLGPRRHAHALPAAPPARLGRMPSVSLPFSMMPIHGARPMVSW